MWRAGQSGWVLCLLLAVSAAAEVVKTTDGLALDLDAQGRVAAVATGGKPWPLAPGAASGLMVRDVAAGGQFVAAGGTVAKEGEELVQSGTNAELKLQFEARFRALPNAISIAGFIRDTSGQDRAITVRWALPVDASGGFWWSDLQNRQAIAGGLFGERRRPGEAPTDHVGAGDRSPLTGP